MLKKWFLVFFIGNCFVFSNAFASNIQEESFPESRIQIVRGVVKNGDTASLLLNKYLPLKTIYQISNMCKKTYPLSRIRKGQPYRIMLEQDRLIEFEYEIDSEDRLVIQNEETGFSVNKLPIYYDVNLELVSATINYSLNSTIIKMGEKNQLANRLADIFAWDIDFIRDIQPGDKFRVLVEKRYREGKLRGYGKIKAAFFTNKGNVYKAFLHTDNRGVSGYYDEEGGSLQKAFLKAPLAFSRISSKFTKKRLHPILKKYKPHNGVDYAAAKGTPIKTVGDGIITKVGYGKGTGNFINIRHFNGYTTRYFHLSKFARSTKKNKKVIQGQVIGYVGMTGYTTGPHLCFRMAKNGKHIDPLNNKAPSANPVKADEMKSFQAKILALSKRIVASSKFVTINKPST
ncbi:MAG: peptidoglycan DD-metalloendopeptidase family protein [Desulfobacula sp.]|nr:peptidoglycan DD-metalloendopeptidase family protein [Desulfobacula sp.]